MRTITIGIPADIDGYVLMKCPICGAYFKVLTEDFEKRVDIYCPVCGMKSDSYYTDEVYELAGTKIMNSAQNEIYDIFKALEKKTKGNVISFKAGKRPQSEPENPIRNKTEAMTIAYFGCCDKTCKIKPIMKMTGCYCPFCGVKEYEP